MQLNSLRVASSGSINLAVAERAWARSGCPAVWGTLVAALQLWKIGGTPEKRLSGRSLPANIFSGGCPAASVSFRSSGLKQARLERRFVDQTMPKADGRTVQARLERCTLDVPASSATGGSNAACAVTAGEAKRQALLVKRWRSQRAPGASAPTREHAPVGVVVPVAATSRLGVECKGRPSAAVAVGKGRPLCSTGPHSRSEFVASTGSCAELATRVDAVPGEVPGWHSELPMEQARNRIPGVLSLAATSRLEVEFKGRPSAAVAAGKGRPLYSTGPRSTLRLAVVALLVASAVSCAPIVRCVPGSVFLACEAQK